MKRIFIEQRQSKNEDGRGSSHSSSALNGLDSLQSLSLFDIV